jgi:exopolyphosphatase/guanosine-5'-triphosphate,3'-diphosphate pyrophosphatase
VSRKPERLAAIDVGSNTVLLTIAEYDPASGLTIVDQAEDQPRLAAGLSSSGSLSEDAMRRALEALTRMRQLCLRRGVRQISAVATAAVREATNGTGFVRRVQALRIPLRVISPDIEAALSYRSAAYRFPGAERTLVADIGGGSLELIAAANGAVRFSTSLPLGAVRLTEMQTSTEILREHISQTLRQAIQVEEWQGARIIGSGGTFATLASLALASRGSDFQEIHGTVVSAVEVAGLMERLAGMAVDQRRETAGLKPERADIIVAGLAVVVELLRAVVASEVTVSGFGLRDGLLLEMIGME